MSATEDDYITFRRIARECGVKGTDAQLDKLARALLAKKATEKRRKGCKPN